MQLGSPNLTKTWSTIRPGSSFILGSEGQKSRSRLTRYTARVLHSCKWWILLVVTAVRSNCNIMWHTALSSGSLLLLLVYVKTEFYSLYVQKCSSLIGAICNTQLNNTQICSVFVELGPAWGLGYGVPPFFLFLAHSLLHFLLFFIISLFLFLICFTYFLLLSIPIFSNRIVSIRFQAWVYRRRLNLVLVCCVHFVLYLLLT